LKTDTQSPSNRPTAVATAKSLPDAQFNELLRLRGMAGVARRALGEVEQLRAQLARQASEAGSNPVTAAMADAIKHGMEQQVESRLSRLNASLHLTAEQAQSAHEILLRQARAMSVGMQQAFSGKFDKEELAKSRKSAGDSDAEIKALLTPDQQAAYPGYQQEEAAHDAALAANGELLQLQSTLGLTSEQLDRAYAALYEVNFNQLTGSAKPPSTNQRAPGDAVTAQAEAMQWAADQKSKALESVLTATQLDNYHKLQAIQAKLVQDIMGKMQGTGGSK